MIEQEITNLVHWKNTWGQSQTVLTLITEQSTRADNKPGPLHFVSIFFSVVFYTPRLIVRLMLHLLVTFNVFASLLLVRLHLFHHLYRDIYLTYFWRFRYSTRFYSVYSRLLVVCLSHAITLQLLLTKRWIFLGTVALFLDQPTDVMIANQIQLAFEEVLVH